MPANAATSELKRPEGADPRATYLNLDAGYKLWQHGKEFTSVDATRLRILLTKTRLPLGARSDTVGLMIDGPA